jgi:hypothetical protein
MNRYRRTSRLAAILAVLGALALVMVGVNRGRTGASAAPGDLPPGWSRSADGRVVTWQSPERLPVQDAHPYIRVGTWSLPAGVARDGRSVSAVIPPGITDLSSLAVTAAGRRLDVEAPGTRQRTRRSLPETPEQDPLPALPADADPGTPGPYETQEGEYEDDDVAIPGLREKVEMKAVVVAPRGATGARPVAVFVHGNHNPCYLPGIKRSESAPLTTWPCVAGEEAVPSYRGYRDPQRLLASQGWITVSVSTNGINGQPTDGTLTQWYSVPDHDAAARAALVQEHLQRWAGWAGPGRGSAPEIVRSSPAPDLGRLLLVGHSRGGEAVNRVATTSASDQGLPWRVQGVVLIGPTAEHRNPAPVPTEVLLPACDGDVYDLQGQSYVDQGRDLYANDRTLRSAVLIQGANHNYFNTEWTPDIAADPDARDDAATHFSSDPGCAPDSPNRLTPEQQRTVGATYIAAGAQALVLGDQDVVPLLDGTPVRAPSAGDARVTAHAVGGNRTPLAVPGPGTAVTGDGGVTATACLTTRTAEQPRACLTPEIQEVTQRSPHAGPNLGRVGLPVDEPTRTAVKVTWASSGRARIPVTERSLATDATAVAMRVVAPPETSGTTFVSRLVDQAGRSLELGPTTLQGLPAGSVGNAGVWWAQEVRLPIDRAALAAAGLDVNGLAHLEIAPQTGGGELWLLDAWAYRPGLVASTRSTARYDLEPKTIDEPSGTVTVPVTGRITGPLDQPVTVFVSVMGATVANPTIEVPAGARTFTIPVEITDDDSVTWHRYVAIRTVAAQGITAAESTAVLVIRNDDAVPAPSIDDATSQEDAYLTWAVRPDGASDSIIFANLRFVPVEGGTELSAGDLPREFLQQYGYQGPLDAPISRTRLGASVLGSGVPLTPGLRIELPVIADGIAEGPESVRIELAPHTMSDPVPGLPTTVTGTVTDG